MEIVIILICSRNSDKYARNHFWFQVMQDNLFFNAFDIFHDIFFKSLSARERYWLLYFIKTVSTNFDICINTSFILQGYSG